MSDESAVFFETIHTPSLPDRLEELSRELGLDYKTVRVWFCNKRQLTKNRAAAAAAAAGLNGNDDFDDHDEMD